MRETSAVAYKEIQEDGILGRQQRIVVECLIVSGAPLTASEIEERTNIRAHKRMRELSRLNRIVEAGQRKCSVTGRQAITWKLSNEDANGQQRLL
jgi:hypothetical protein